jgi:hypothetical protein
MDARAGRHPGHEPDRIDVRIADPGEIAASIPHLLGFRPRESVVLISLTGPSGGRVGLTVRGDIPPAEHAAAMAAVLTRSVCTDRPRGVVLAVVSEAPDDDAHLGNARLGDALLVDLPHRALVHELVVALASADIPVRDALLVRAGRWWSYDCPRPCCAPGAGTALPVEVSQLEVASVATGMVVEQDRGDLAARIARPGGRARRAMAATCAQVAAECSAQVLDAGWDVVAAESCSAITAAAARCRPGAPVAGSRLTDREVARIVWGLRDGVVRDRSLELAMGPDAAAAEVLWTECTRRAPAPLDAAPATLLAVSVWLRGDGAMANIALTRALDSEPGYALARLLAQALVACLPPSDLRAMIDSTLARLGDAHPAG